MTQLVLTEEQARLIRQALEPLQLCDPQGNVLRTIEPELTGEFIAELKRRAASPGPHYTSEQVQSHLQGLEEAWVREGGFDRSRMHEILRELRSKNLP
ncbi:MAG: hypothetical protein ACJ8FY_28545 [Gemmataceae bacterium]